MAKAKDEQDQDETPAATDPIAGAASSAQAATGAVIEVPKTPEAIAEQATELGNSGDYATGGSPDDRPRAKGEPRFRRVWGMDADHTERNRNDPDQLKPDLSVQE